MTTRWSDSMILIAIRDGGMLTQPARERAFELCDLGMVTMTGTWALTPAGKDYLRRNQSAWLNA